MLKAAAPALGWAESNTFAVTGTSRPVAVKAATMKPGQLSVVAAGPITLPDASENPTEQGGILTITGASGRVQHNLPAEAWKALGAGGSKGFRFSGSVCNVVLKANVIKAACSKTGTLALPESGPLQVVLSIGASTRYCGACGGTPKGNATKAFKRKACALPAACP